MRIDDFSLAFNCPGCPAWGTSIVEQDSQLVHLIKTDVATNIVIGVVHKMIPLYTNDFSLPIGKGSKIYNGKDGFDNATSEPILLAKFDKCFVNGNRVNKQFLLAIIKDRAEAHMGRLQIKFIPKIKYGAITNADFYEEARKVLNIESNIPWAIYDIDVHNQEELHFKAVFAESINELKDKLDNVEINVTTNEQSKFANITANCIRTPLQTIFYGAPGTGKSHEISKQTKGYAVVRTTFHPDSDHSTFVGTYKPTMTNVRKSVVIGQDEKEVKPLTGNSEYESKIHYSFVKQAFLKAYLGAWRKYASNPTAPKPQFLVIEEINRGNCAQIFGDIFQLLDREDNGFSSYPIEADTDLQQAIVNAFKDEDEYKISDLNVDEVVADYTSNYGTTLSEDILKGRVMLLPPNFYIWATMNTSDQSLFPIDSAFKRRWDWTYMPIDTEKEQWYISVEGIKYSWSSFLKKINNEIQETTSSEDKQLGFYFCKAENGEIKAEKFVSKVLFYLYNDVFKDYGLEREFFKDKENANETITFRSLYKSVNEVNTANVIKLLNNLEVEIADEEDYDDTEEADGDSFDSGKFTLNGSDKMSLKDIANKIVADYAKAHPSMTSTEIRDYFIEKCKGCKISHIVETEAEFTARASQQSAKRTVSEVILPNGEKVYVCTQFRAKNPDDNFYKFMEIVNENSWGTITQIS